MAELQEVPSCQSCTQHLIDSHRPLGSREITLDHHYRSAHPPTAGEVQRFILSRDDDDAFHALPHQMLNRVIEGLPRERR